MNATRAFLSTFKEPYTIPNDLSTWVEGRQPRYVLYRAAFNNTLYSKSEKFSPTFKRWYGVYKHTRDIENLFFVLVETYVTMTVGGSIDEELKTGAFPVMGADETKTEAIKQILDWSNWEINKSLFARFNAMLGDVGLWIVDDPVRKQVRVEVLDPAKIKEALFDEIGNVKSAVIEYEREWRNPDTGKMETVLYRMEVNKEWFRTYKDDKPYAWDEVEAWPNPYGFVPLRMVKFRDVGFDWGASCYHTGIPKINEANDLGSVLDDGIRKAADPPWYLAGVSGGDDLEFSGQLDDGTATTEASAQRDHSGLLYGPKDSQPHSMAPTIPVADINQRYEILQASMERDNPVLAPARMREKTAGMSGVAIRNMFADVEGIIHEVMGNQDNGIVRAVQMAISIAAFRGYEKFTVYTLDSYKQGAIGFSLKARSIWKDTLSLKEKIDVMKSLPDNPVLARYIMVNQVEIAESDADEIIQGMLQQQAMKQQQQAAQFGNGNSSPITVSHQQPPQLTAGQGVADNGAGDDVSAEVQRLLSEVGIAA